MGVRKGSPFIEGKTLTHPTVGAEQWTELFLLDRPVDVGDKWVHLSFFDVVGGLNQSSDRSPIRTLHRDRSQSAANITRNL